MWKQEPQPITLTGTRRNKQSPTTQRKILSNRKSEKQSLEKM